MSAIPDKPRLDLAGPLRDADWLDAARARAYARVLGVVLALITLAWFATSLGGPDANGKAIGTDFTSFYAASRLALDGRPSAIYDLVAHAAAQNAIFRRPVEYAAFLYPPLYLLICLPFALFPYLPALLLWQGLSLAFYWRVARQFAGSRLGALPLFAFPAVMLNVGHGQNAFLSAGLFGAGVLWLDKRPALAGVMFGLLAYKPHLGLVIPLVLAVNRRWTSFVAAGITVVAMAGLSLLMFGMETWRGFIAISPLATAALEHDLVGAHKMQSAYAAIRVLGGGSNLAYLVQAIVALATLAILLRVQMRRQRLAQGRSMAETPLMIAACLLTSPFLLDYDLVLLALPMAWLFREAMRTGFAPYEKITLFAAFVLPLVTRQLADLAHLPLGPFVIFAVFWLVARRAAEPGPEALSRA